MTSVFVCGNHLRIGKQRDYDHSVEGLGSHRIRSKTRARLPVLCWHLRILCVWFMQLLHVSTVLDSPKYALLSGPLSLTWGEEAGTSAL